MKSLSIAVYSLIAIHFLRKTCWKLSPDRHIHVDRAKPFYMVLSRGTRDGSTPPPPVRIAMCRDYAVARELLMILHAAERPGLAFYPVPAPEILPNYGRLLQKRLAAPLDDNIARLGVPLNVFVHENLKAAIRRLREDSATLPVHWP